MIPADWSRRMDDRRTDSLPRFKDQVALVVGAAHGIGKAIAVRLGREGAEVVIADVDPEGMETTIQEMHGEGSRCKGVTCDVRDQAQVEAAVKQAIGWHGRIDILMYIAGIADAVPFLELDVAMWDNTLNINLRGAFLTARAVVPHMVARRTGKLVFMASTNSWDGEAQLAHYNVTKSGVFLLAKTLAREFGKFGIRSNAVGPGPIRTRLSGPILNDPIYQQKYHPETGVIPLGRMGTPEEVAGPALFLASDDAAYVSGVLLFVDGGQLA
jgi:NAD(P)-dependent dehydrogenase (short-subunit alcohol dehydrogenase family)